MSEDTKRLSITEFAKNYNVATSEQIKTLMLKKIFKEQDIYIPYQQKIESAKKVIEKSNYVYDEGEKKFVFNGPVQYLYYVKALLDLYTNFQLNEPFYEEYDALNQNDLLSVIMQRMPVDKVEFDMIFNMVRDDSEQNHYYRIIS